MRSVDSVEWAKRFSRGAQPDRILLRCFRSVSSIRYGQTLVRVVPVPVSQQGTQTDADCNRKDGENRPAPERTRPGAAWLGPARGAGSTSSFILEGDSNLGAVRHDRAILVEVSVQLNNFGDPQVA